MVVLIEQFNLTGNKKGTDENACAFDFQKTDRD
jgi:hypothetical protein